MVKSFHQDSVDFFRTIYGDGLIPLHRPVFEGCEKQYLIDCIDSNFVSSIGARVDEFERKVAKYVGTKFVLTLHIYHPQYVPVAGAPQRSGGNSGEENTMTSIPYWHVDAFSDRSCHVDADRREGVRELLVDQLGALREHK